MNYKWDWVKEWERREKMSLAAWIESLEKNSQEEEQKWNEKHAQILKNWAEHEHTYFLSKKGSIHHEKEKALP